MENLSERLDQTASMWMTKREEILQIVCAMIASGKAADDTPEEIVAGAIKIAQAIDRRKE